MPKTDTPTVPIESIRPAIAELERAALWAVDSLGMDIITDPITIVVQTRGRKTVCGWFSTKRWATKEGVEVDEVTITAERLQDAPADIIETLIHEMVHVQANHLGIKDVSKSGRHNKKFKELAELAGLEVEAPFNSHGFSYTSLSGGLAVRVEKEFKPDYTAFNMFRQLVPKAPKQPTKQKKWTCGDCGLIVRMAVIRNVKCEDCDVRMVKEEDDG